MQTFKTSKQQRQAASDPVMIANIESKLKEIMGKIGKLNLHKINTQVLDLCFE